MATSREGAGYCESRQRNLRNLVFGKAVTVETKKQGRYGRAVGKVVADGRDANLEQVKSGFAWHNKGYQREQSAEDRSQYASTEDSAKASGRGLWLDKSPVKPEEHGKG